MLAASLNITLPATQLRVAVISYAKKSAASMMSTSCLHLPLTKLHHYLDLIDDFHDDFSIAVDQSTNGIGLDLVTWDLNTIE